MPGDDILIAYHESGHAVVAAQFGFDTRHVQLHRDGSGCCELRRWLSEVNDDSIRCLIYLFAAGAAEKRASGRPSVSDGQDRMQAAALASYVHDHADASDPRVMATLRAAETLADAMIQNPTTWSAIERTARALRRRKYLSGRDVQEIIHGGRR